MYPEFIERVLMSLEEDLGEELTLNDLSNRHHYSPYHISTSFKKYVGVTLKYYRMRRRLNQAVESLRDPSSRILDVALEWGYGSQEAFSRAFQKVYGITPKVFRQGDYQVLDYPNKGHYKEDKMISETTGLSIQDNLNISHPVRVVHVLNGSCMLQTFRSNQWMKEDSTYIAFNEAMCWGRGHQDLFGHEFIQERIKYLKSDQATYKERVIEELKPLLKGDYDHIVLWFGTDMFCQMNLLTLLAYLDVKDYKGHVFVSLLDEIKDEYLNGALEVEVKGYYSIYKQVIVEQRKPTGKLDPLLYQAVESYLTYSQVDSPINTYIRKHIDMDENHLIANLLEAFKEYGLGDYQYQLMIRKVKGL